jgi:serine/threonine protein kinase
MKEVFPAFNSSNQRMALIKHTAVQILQGLNVLSHLGIIHCDLKPENILMTSRRPDET